MHYDLIVIGMGLSGLMAAKTAAEAGQRVLIIGKGMGFLCLFSNTIDVLDQTPALGKMKDSLARWIHDHPLHPYAKTGIENIEEALSSFLSLFPSSYFFQNSDRSNCLLPTGAGTYRPAYLVPRTMSAGITLHDKKTLIVGFEGFKDFYAKYAAGQLKCRGINLQLPDLLSHEVTATALARLFERSSFREKIGNRIKEQLQDETAVGLPALLGIHNPVQVMEDLEKTIGGSVFEIPILPPSIPGIRIYNQFKEWLIRKGVNFLQGYFVSEAVLKGKRCERIVVSHPPVTTPYSADQYILATGRFIGGGLKARYENIFEPLFNLPLFQPPAREDWFRKAFFNDLPHPVHQAGILTDSYLRPVEEAGEPILENVWIAGSILAHHAALDEKSKEGIEIATGYTAAKNAIDT